jgi:hypothetical protein
MYLDVAPDEFVGFKVDLVVVPPFLLGLVRPNLLVLKSSQPGVAKVAPHSVQIGDKPVTK